MSVASVRTEAKPNQGVGMPLGKPAIADLHCHYPMHLFPDEHNPGGRSETWGERLRNALQADAVDLVAHLVNDEYLTGTWRVTLDGLEQGGAKLVCSVLYWPPAEFDFAVKYATPPLAAYFGDIKYQMEKVEQDLLKLDPKEQRVIVARTPADLGDPRMSFVHCVEGALQLGPGSTPGEIDQHVEWLARRGVLYITLAHLFYRQVATNAPAIPALSDRFYNAVFTQPAIGLTPLGKAVVEAMYKHKVLIDISHMTQMAIDETFTLVEKLDRDSGREPQEYPLIATHVGMRTVGPRLQEYNLSEETAQRIHARGGLIGLITAQHQLGSSSSEAESETIVCRHLQAIEAAVGDHTASALGTDIDGFIKPTLAGFEQAQDLTHLEAWIRTCAPQDADAILYDNALRVAEVAFAGRPLKPAPAPPNA